MTVACHTLLPRGAVATAAMLLLLLAASAAKAQLNISTVTLPATAITGTSATLNGTVNGNGEDISAVYFDWGPTLPYANIFVNATPPNVTAGQGQTAVSLNVGGLACGSTYHFRVTADDSNGRNAQGADMSFTTLGCPVAPSARPVPALSPWSLLALSGLVGAVAWALRRRGGAP
jgi:hypothetical protein